MKKTLNQTNYNYYLENYKETGDIDLAKKIADMIVSGVLLVKVQDNEVRFVTNSRFKNKCIRCNKYYLAGEPAFFQNSKGWHMDCATEEEKANHSFYQQCFKKGEINKISTNKQEVQLKTSFNKLKDDMLNKLSTQNVIMNIDDFIDMHEASDADRKQLIKYIEKLQKYSGVVYHSENGKIYAMDDLESASRKMEKEIL